MQHDSKADNSQLPHGDYLHKYSEQTLSVSAKNLIRTPT